MPCRVGRPRPHARRECGGRDGAERRRLDIYILPILGNAWIGDIDLPDLNETVRGLTLKDGTPASGGTKSTVAAVLRRLFAWAREERIIPANPALELRTGWGSSVRRRVLIPSIPQVLCLAEALDYFKPGLGDVAMVLAFTDSLSSVRGVVSSTGTLAATTSYDAWGNPETTGGLSASAPFGYAGGYTDATGLVYLINR